MAEKFFKLGIIGWPLGYSLSPKMHTVALQAAGLKGEYKEYKVKPEELENWLKTEAPKLDGFNVTMPHKEVVYRWIKEHGEIHNPTVLDAIGAVNTVKVTGTKLIGYNTDGRGFFDSLPKNLDLKGGRVLLLGAGGAAQAVAVWLAIVVQVASLKIWNRNKDRAERLALKLESLATPCRPSVSEIGTVDFSRIDLIVNATPLGMKAEGEVPQELLGHLAKRHVVFDLVYEPEETGLLRAGKQVGCSTIGGKEMLASQGVEAFEIWVEERFNPETLRSVMRKAIE